MELINISSELEMELINISCDCNDGNEVYEYQ